LKKAKPLSTDVNAGFESLKAYGVKKETDDVASVENTAYLVGNSQPVCGL